MPSYRVSPTLHELSAAFEDFPSRHLGKVVGLLKIGAAILNGKIVGWIIQDGPEEVPTDLIMSCSVGDFLFICKGECACVVFVHCCLDRMSRLHSKGLWYIKIHNEFLEEFLDGHERANALT